ncbi:signal peptidase I [Candidatus Peregrinibacteria bacterium RIFCSPLOWO2_02_FULL_39_10]|nr:MAG: signal peptidase I [Candidatus Peregrinibacteria bacterium RIFCSPLOWO2_02_FULL_39_10]
MKEKNKRILLWILDILINIAIIFGLVLIIQKWVVAPFDVSGTSMCDTLNFVNGECKNGYGEKIIINEAGYFFSEPERGEIVVFKAPKNNPDEEEKYFIKRVIGLPGDKVEIKKGEIYITPKGSKEAVKINEDYLNADNKGKTKTFFSGFSVFEVPENKYFLLGDNRKASTDSRSCFNSSISIDCKNSPDKAFISREAIRGKTWIVWWPLTHIRIIDHHEYTELNKLQNP